MVYILIAGNLVMLLSFILRLSHIPPQLPLFYSRTHGEDQLADSWFIILLPILLNGLYIVNSLIFRKFFTGNDFVRKIVIYLNGSVIVSLTLIFVKIIFLVT